MEDIHPLTAFREKHDPPLSQGQLAKLVDVSRPTVTRWENRTRQIDDRRLPRVSERTGISPAVLRPDLADIFKQAAE